jgi:predicted enzyme related to lactoylglutathione lyase
MKKMNPVVHFELPADNKDRMVDFYTNVFGWNAQRLGPDMGNYVVVSTTEADEHGRPKSPGAINGGLFDRAETSKYPSIVIAVDNIRESMKSVEEAGGKIIGGGHKAGEPDDIPGVGLYIAFIDTEGNRLGMLQPSPNM